MVLHYFDCKKYIITTNDRFQGNFERGVFNPSFLFLYGDGSPRYQIEFVNSVQTVVCNVYAFYQPGFAKSIGNQVALFNIL